MTESGKSEVNLSKRRKLLFDDETRSFRYESNAKTIDRMGDLKMKEALAKNRGEERILEATRKQTNIKSRWYEKKNAKEVNTMRDSLKEKGAHKTILDEVSQQYSLDENNNGAYGKYGPNATKSELLPRIETALKQMEPSFKRQKQAEQLLEKRKKIESFDRTLSTSAILTRNRKKAIEMPVHVCDHTDDCERKRTAAKLVLPPIVVKKSKTKLSRSTPSKISEQSRVDSLPSIFVTQSLSEKINAE